MVCSASKERNRRISLATGICPLGHFHAADISSPPIISGPPPIEGSNEFKLTRLRNSGNGRILILVANGNSRDEAGLERLLSLPNVDFMSINKPLASIWPTKFWCMVDNTQPPRHRKEFSEFRGTMFCTGRIKEIHEKAIIVRNAQEGFQTDIVRHGSFVGKTTTHFSLQIAAWMGYDHIYVFGLDMARGANGRLYAWGSNPDVDDAAREGKFKDENKTLDASGKAMGEEMRKRITICSRYAIAKGWSFLQHFESLDHLTAVQTIIDRHGNISNSSPPSISILTCTGGRQEAFDLCEKWVGRSMARYGAKVEWIVVDDGEQPTICRMGQKVLRPFPFWSPGTNTHSRNMLLGMEQVATEAVIIMEDDDWFAPDFLPTMAELLSRFDLVGEGNARYYNVRFRSYLALRNGTWSSATGTGFRRPLFEQFKNSLSEYAAFDQRFWHSVEYRKHLFFGRGLLLGVKGMPGRPGAASGHKHHHRFNSDPDLSMLRSWIGNDADDYARFHRTDLAAARL